MSQCMACNQEAPKIHLVTVPATIEGKVVVGLALVCTPCLQGHQARIPLEDIFPGIPTEQIVIQEKR